MVLRIDKDKALTWIFDGVLDRWYLLYAGHVLADRYRARDALSRAELQTLSDLVEKWRSR